MQRQRKQAPARKRGPPPFRPTRAQRSKVELYVAGGMAEPEIAHVIGVCQNTLRKHFAEELLFGRARKVATNLGNLEKAAAAGNVSAMKHLDAKFAVAGASASFESPEPKAKLGKKQEAQLAAATAGDGTDWGDDLKAPGALN